jgi:hypothetical protein
MPVNHSVFSKSHSDRNDWFEGIYFFLDGCGNRQNVFKTLFISELGFSSGNRFQAVLEGLLELLRIQLFPCPFGPSH